MTIRMKKVFKWLGALFLFLLSLPIITLSALYMPPIQQWIGEKAMLHLSAQTGYTCSLEHIRLRFPLRMHISNLRLADDRSTLVSIGQVGVSAKLRPLWQGEAVAHYINIEGVTLHTDTLLRNIEINGTASHIRLDDIRFKWKEHALRLNRIGITDFQLDVTKFIAKESPRDTMYSTPFATSVNSIKIARSSFSYIDSQREIFGDIPTLALQSLEIDTLHALSLQRGILREGQLYYKPAAPDKSDWHFMDINCNTDSLLLMPDERSGIVSSLTLRERHGIVVEEASLAFATSNGTIRLPYFTLVTKASSLNGHLHTVERQTDTWVIDGDIKGSIGHEDIINLSEMLPGSSNSFLRHYPKAPLLFNMAVVGPLNNMHLTHCQLSLATALDAYATGYMKGWPDTRHLTAHIDLDATLYNLDFLTTLFSTTRQGQIQIPHDIGLKASFTYQADSILAQVNTRSNEGTLIFHGRYIPHTQQYTLTLRTDTLDLRSILPTRALGSASLLAAIEGSGLDWDAPSSHIACSIWIDSLELAERTYSNAHLQASLHNHQLQMEASYADTLIRLALKGTARYTASKLQAHLYAHVFESDLQGLGITEVDIQPSFQSHCSLTIDTAQVYTLRAHLYDIALTSTHRTIRPLPISLNTRLTPDSIAIALEAGDLHLTANAHTYELPWRWNKASPTDDEAPKPLTALNANLQGGSNNPISNFLLLTGVTVSSINARLYEEVGQLTAVASIGRLSARGIMADTAILTAQYIDRRLTAHVQTSNFVWQSPLMQLTGSASANILWSDAFHSNNINGTLRLSDIHMSLPSYSLQLTTADTLLIPFEQGQLTLHNVAIYAQSKQPIVLDGTIALLGDAPTLQLQLDAQDVSLLQSRRTQESTLYGTALLKGRVSLAGRFDALTLQGNLTLRGGSSLYYIYKDASLTANNSLDDVVTFVDFNAPPTSMKATTQIRPTDNFAMNLNVTIEPTVQLEVLLGASGENYSILQGGGNLNIQYIPAVGLRLSGRYTVMSGELQMNVPLLHVHSMTIRSGSTVQWSGNALNPMLAVIIEDQIRTSVTIDDIPQTVLFLTGISLSNTLEHLGIQFTLSAPENASMQNILAALSPDERNKLAVALLTTGLYLGEGGTGNLMNTALISFLQSQLDNISRDTFRSVDVSFGIEPLQDGVSGVSTRTDYSFSIAKRFWHDRIRIIIGGSVTTSNERIEDNAIIDNLSIEWRIRPNGSQYLRFFYDKNFESILEGEIRETGIGYAYKRRF